MYPDAIVEDENGYLMVDLPVLMDIDDLIAKLVLEGGVARLVSRGAEGGELALSERNTAIEKAQAMARECMNSGYTKCRY